jgi:hypothetical protein
MTFDNTIVQSFGENVPFDDVGPIRRFVIYNMGECKAPPNVVQVVQKLMQVCKCFMFQFWIL